MATLSGLRTDVRARLNEPTARFWSDSQLNTWINEGCRVIARRAEVIQSFNTSVAAVVGQQKYDVPADVIRVHRVEFQPTGNTQVYPLKPSTDDEMESVVGINPLSQSSYPSFFTLWGLPGAATGSTAAMKMKVFPVPAQTGTFFIYYYRQPVALVGDNDVAEIPAGWDDLVAIYCEYVSLLKDRDDRWKDVKQVFEMEMNYLIDVTRQYHDQERTMQMPTGLSTPSWLYSFGDS